jgi:hypothetical protein
MVKTIATTTAAPKRQSARLKGKQRATSRTTTPKASTSRITPLHSHTTPLSVPGGFGTPGYWDNIPDRDHSNDPPPEEYYEPKDPADPSDGGDDGGGDDDSDGELSVGNGPRGPDGGANPPDPEPTWQEALILLAGINQRAQSAAPSAPRAPRTRAREPEPFNGANPDDLPRFLFQCRLYFRANPAQFESGSTKVNFALTFLSDVTLCYHHNLNI